MTTEVMHLKIFSSVVMLVFVLMMDGTITRSLADLQDFFAA
jgi:hypothetical protein